MALRADWQKQILRCHTELGFNYVRFHGILLDDMGTLVCELDKFVYSFFNADQVCDFLLSIGMRPFVELSFMPSALASGGDIVFHYKGNVTPPKDYSQWETLIYTLVLHWAERYGTSELKHWFFEVWNEPNLSAFWKGSQADYFRLYQHTAHAIKRVHADLQVGGPATADNAWITDFINFTKENNVPVDFISTHHYPTDDFGQPGDDTVAQLAASRRSVLRDEAAATKKQAGALPVYYTEWSSSSNPFDELHDMPYAAAFIVKTVMEARGSVQGYSYWTFSDIFEENYFASTPFHGGFGLLNIHGIPKPAYRAFQLLHELGNEILPVTGSHDTIDVWITKKPGFFNILITNYALPKHPIKAGTITIEINGIKNITSATIERIDDNNANALGAWIAMGKPGTLTPPQIATLEAASALTKQSIEIRYDQDSAFIEVYMEIQGTACITLATV